MKKIIYLCLAACLFSTLAFAQKITAKELEGTWKITGFSTQGIGFDLQTQEVTLTPDMKAQLSPESVAGIKEGMKQAVEQIKSSYVSFTGNNMKLVVGPETESGTFTLAEKNGAQVLAVKNTDGTTHDVPVLYKDKKLYMSLGDKGEEAEFIFMK